MPRKKRKEYPVVTRHDETLVTFSTCGVRVTVKTPERRGGTMCHQITCTTIKRPYNKEPEFKTITLDYDEVKQLKACFEEALILMNPTS